MAKRAAIASVAFDLLFLDDDADDIMEEEESWEEIFFIISGLLSRSKKLRIENYLDVVRNFTNDQFVDNFRLDRQVVYQLIEQYGRSRFHPVSQGHCTVTISAEKAVLMFLCFAVNKCCLRDVAERFGVCNATTFRYNDTVMDFLVSIAPNVIKLPDDNQVAASEFENIYQFPGVLGIIDGTHIRIRTPAGRDRATYGDRDKQTTMGLQVVCDANRRFIDVCTGFPGRTHDSTMFSLSEISNELPGRFGEYYHLVGDSAYPLQRNLITPYSRTQRPLDEDESKFNTRVSQLRVLVENTIALLRNLFRGLMNIDMMTVDKMTKFTISCCVLHNLRIDKSFTIERTGPIDNWESIMYVDERILRADGTQKRNMLKQTLINEL